MMEEKPMIIEGHMKDTKVAEAGFRICGCYTSYNFETEQITFSYCPIHAAAPDLLEALLGVSTNAHIDEPPCFCKHMDWTIITSDMEHQQRCRKARAAIAQAQAEPPADGADAPLEKE